jgi:hypothetical protein
VGLPAIPFLCRPKPTPANLTYMARETKSRLERLRVAAEAKAQPPPSTFTMDFYRSTCERGGLATALIPLLKMAQERMKQPSLFPPLPACGVAGFSASFRQVCGYGMIYFIPVDRYVSYGFILKPDPCRKLEEVDRKKGCISRPLAQIL